MSTPTFLQQLRESTAAAHQSLEDSPLSQKLMMPGVTLADYTAYLQQMQPVIAFADEQLLPQVSAIIPAADERKKLHWLEDDLAMLHSSASSPAFQPRMQADTAYTLGFFYVIEGSVLGGRVILKHLQKLLPVSAEKGGRFFAGYGEATSEKWKSFLEAFVGYVTAHGAEAAAIAGANDAFAAIKQHFNNA